MREPLWKERAEEWQPIFCVMDHGDRVDGWRPMKAREAAERLKELDERFPDQEGRFYAVGDHVSDPYALVARYYVFLGWMFLGPQRLVCPSCKEKLGG